MNYQLYDVQSNKKGTEYNNYIQYDLAWVTGCKELWQTWKLNDTLVMNDSRCYYVAK